MAARQPKKLMVIMGTRPEVIKLAPVIYEARRRPDRFETCVVTTSQHREMLDQMLRTFDIEKDFDLDIMTHDQGLGGLTAAAMSGLDRVIGENTPDIVIVQGDTTTSMVGALAAFYHRIPVAHVEAGLRTDDKSQPFPEEINRRLISQIADFHFAPTDASQRNLIREGVSAERTWVTGNTCIDALFHILETRSCQRAEKHGRRILITAHRRENHGAPMKSICRAILRLANEFPDLHFTYPVHLNPRVREIVYSMLQGHDRISLADPLDYPDFVLAMNEADIILTDSGGVQEEAPSLGKPVLVLRNCTERPEGIEAGTLRLVGTDEDTIVEQTSKLLLDEIRYREMSHARNPFGDGKAASRIVTVLEGM